MHPEQIYTSSYQSSVVYKRKAAPSRAAHSVMGQDPLLHGKTFVCLSLYYLTPHNPSGLQSEHQELLQWLCTSCRKFKTFAPCPFQ